MFKDDESVKFLQDPGVAKQFSSCKTLSDVNPSEYDAVFYPGGKVPILRPGDCRLTFHRAWTGH